MSANSVVVKWTWDFSRNSKRTELAGQFEKDDYISYRNFMGGGIHIHDEGFFVQNKCVEGADDLG